MFQKIIKWIFIASLKQKKLFIKDNFLTDNEENFTILMRVIEKTTPNTNDLLIIDIGAYDGRSSILFSEKFPKNSIIAFEPNKNSYQLALKNCADYPNIKIYNIALSATTAIAEFNITKNSVSSSLNTISNPSSLNQAYNNQLLIVEKMLVETKPLDAYAFEEDILFMKIDTQGNEIKVLEGSINTLKNTLFVLVELSNHDIYVDGCKYYEVDSWFREHNFTLVDIIITSRKNGILLTEYDAIYANKNKVTL